MDGRTLLGRVMAQPKKFQIEAGATFGVEKTEDEVIIHFADTGATLPGQIHLRSVIRTFGSMKTATYANAKHIYYISNRLKSLYQLIQDYNQGLGSEDLYYTRYIKYQMMQQMSVFGYQVPNATTKIEVLGLADLITALDAIYKTDIDFYKECLAGHTIVFDGLLELYKPGCIVRGITALGVPAGFRVVDSYFQERKTLFGFEQSFHLQLHYIATMGEDFAVVEFESVLSRWMGESTRKLSDMMYVPAEPDLLEKFATSGAKYVELGLGKAKYLHHDAGCVFLKGNSASVFGGKTTTLHTSGRVMIDVVRGSALGHHASQGIDDASHALIELTGRYKRFKSEQKSLGKTGSQPDSLFIISGVPKQLIAITWPALVGFSFTSKAWCHVLVNGLSEIQYNDKAFDQLVLDSKRKRLIQALVKYGGEQFEDIIQGKRGGSVFLLHGAPGVGKTLTAEAVAEVLHKPLYYVTMGELGTDPETMEKRIGEILNLCSGWDALTLIDEADVFLEKRATSDVLRNAMVCVMLRLLEYHDGILFLTTNRVTEFDPAFESRVTVALKYDHLSEAARQQVWKNLTRDLRCGVKQLDYAKLGGYVLNGRQIKNAVRLGVALALDQKLPLSQELLEETIEITNLGRYEMKTADKY
jgi:hypothetical protein